jgi:hypothetical protein
MNPYGQWEVLHKELLIRTIHHSYNLIMVLKQMAKFYTLGLGYSNAFSMPLQAAD